MIGERDGERLDFETALGAETAALQRIDEANFFFRKIERFRHLVQRAEGRVVGDPDRDPAAFGIDLRVRGVRLYRRVLYDRHGVALFENDIRFVEALLDVSGPEFEVLADVRLSAGHDEFHLAIAREILVNRDRAGLAGFFSRSINGQVFVLDFDQPGGGLRRVLVHRGHSRDRLADVADFVLR